VKRSPIAYGPVGSTFRAARRGAPAFAGVAFIVVLRGVIQGFARWVEAQWATQPPMDVALPFRLVGPLNPWFCRPLLADERQSASAAGDGNGSSAHSSALVTPTVRVLRPTCSAPGRRVIRWQLEC